MTGLSSRRIRIDHLGALLGLAAIAAALWLPLLVYKASRIALGDARSLVDALPLSGSMALMALLLAVAVIAILSADARVRLLAALLGVLGVACAIVVAADALVPAGNRVVRIAPGAGFWLLLLMLTLLATDALSRLRPGPGLRVLYLALAAGVVYLALSHSIFDNLSIMREYAANASSFGREARRHVLLALGSVCAAVLAGLPIGILCHRVPRVRGAVLETLNLIQTIPSIALFGVLMVPLGALATAVPFIGELGIHGIGAAPAVIALFLYALLPVVANTVVGLGRVSPQTVDAARGVGLTDRQILRQVEMPLALPVIVTGVRIVLVQSIGLVTVAALIGGGGLGTFVFQGVGQTAIDLVLLGAIPTVALAFASTVVLDALVEVMNRTSP